jgi:hypothetical protein
MIDPCFVQRFQSIKQSWNSPVQHVIVCKDAAIDFRRGKAMNVVRAHFVVDVLFLPGYVAAGYGRFQVDHLCPRRYALELLQSVTPDIAEFDGATNRSAWLLGKLHIARRAIHARLMKSRVSRKGQDLVYPPSRHHVTTQKQGQKILHLCTDFL